MGRRITNKLGKRLVAAAFWLSSSIALGQQSQRVKISDDNPASDILTINKESNNYSNSQYGLLVFGIDDEGPNRKWRPLDVDTNGHLNVAQATSPWVTSRNWTLSNSTDSVASVQSGTWTTGRTWTLSNGTDSIAAVQSGNWAVRLQDGVGNALSSSTSSPTGSEQALIVRNIPSGTQNVSQGTSPWVTSRNWNLISASDSVSAVQSGTWTVQQGTPPWSVSQSGNWSMRLQDGSGNNISSQASGGQRALDIGIDVAGTQVDPRTRTWTLSDPSDTVKADQGTAASLSGKWPVQITDGTNVHPTADVASRAAFSKITDGTNVAVVEPSGTAAATTDPSLAVNISPNSPMAFSDRVLTGNITTACSTGVSCAGTSMVVVQTNGAATIGYETHGTWSGSITTDVSYDSTCFSSPGAANWYQTGSIDTQNNVDSYLVTWNETFNNDPWIMPIAGSQCARVRASAMNSGTVNVTLDASTGSASNWSIAIGNVKSGSADAGNPIKVGGKYNATKPSLSDGNRGDLQLDPFSSQIITPQMLNRTDVSSTVSSSGNSSTFDSDGLTTISTIFNVTAISGTGTNIIFHLQHSDDNSNWTTIDDSLQLSATGTFSLAPLRLSTRYYRFTWTVAGSSPSVTFTIISTLKMATSVPHFVGFRYADINLAANGNASSIFYGEDCRNLAVQIVRGAGGSNAQVQIFGSIDGINFVTESANIAVNPSTTNISTLANVALRYWEIQTTTHGGVGDTANIFWSCD